MNLWRFSVQFDSFLSLFARINALVLSAFLHKLVVYPLENHDAEKGIFVVRGNDAVAAYNDQKRASIVTSQ